MDFLHDPSLVLYLPLGDLDGDSIQDQSAYGHTCAVTNATLYPGRGRYFGSANDVITVPKTASINNIFTGGATLIVELNPDSLGEANNGHILNKDDMSILALITLSSGFVKSRLYTVWSGDDGFWTSDDAVVPLGTRSTLAVTYNSDSTGNNPVFYLNGITVASTEGGTPTGSITDDSGGDLLIGNRANLERDFDGLINNVWAYTRIFTPLEIQNHYLAAKDR